MELCDGKSEKASEGMPLSDGGISACTGEGAFAEEPQLSEWSAEDSQMSLGSGPDGLSLLPEVDVFGAPLVAEVEEDAPALVKKLGKNNRKGFNPFGFKLKKDPGLTS